MGPPDSAPREYAYVGPPELLEAASDRAPGCPVGSPDELDRRLAVGAREPFTYIVDTAGRLLLADRRSEHVWCAAGQPVRAAGEVSFRRRAGRWEVDEVTNQSTGYCPEPESWAAVADALDRAGIGHSGGFTAAFVFRRCAACGNLNLVKDGDYTCCLCGRELTP